MVITRFTLICWLKGRSALAWSSAAQGRDDWPPDPFTQVAGW